VRLNVYVISVCSCMSQFTHIDSHSIPDPVTTEILVRFIGSKLRDGWQWHGGARGAVCCTQPPFRTSILAESRRYTGERKSSTVGSVKIGPVNINTSSDGLNKMDPVKSDVLCERALRSKTCLSLESTNLVCVSSFDQTIARLTKGMDLLNRFKSL
ncbi:jg6295, partial [Pararge aegeria aegeria]